MTLLIDLETNKSRLLCPFAGNMTWLDAQTMLVADTVLDLDGKTLYEVKRDVLRHLPPAPDAGPRLLVKRTGGTLDHDVAIVNVRTQALTGIDLHLPDRERLGNLLLDADERPAAVTTVRGPFANGSVVVSHWYREVPDGPWQLLARQDLAKDEVWVLLRLLPDRRSIAVLARGDRDTRALQRYDTATRTFTGVIAGHAEEDVLASEAHQPDQLQRVLTDGLKATTRWFDQAWADLQASIDHALPHTTNWLSGKPDGQVLIQSFSGADPGRWRLLDTSTNKTRLIASARDDIGPAEASPVEAYRYRARDGLSIPAYLTRPRHGGEGPLPTIALIHGGPWARDRWQWDLEAQMLADHGYVVFQPQFRGSSGFGLRFEQAGYRQFGLAMQDDITDGVQDLVDRGIADPRRIAIVGASYGGYAALWGLIKTPTLYCCGVSLAGISDLAEQVVNHWGDDSTATVRERNRQLIGDVETARASLEAVSPIRHAEALRKPVFLAHGNFDERVLPSQSARMVSALKALKRPVESMTLYQSGHSPSHDDLLQYWETLIPFLERHAGGLPLRKDKT